ncbi:MAG: hypothetical protein IJJ69_06025, partial [Oscillospiraceae bacterium]|nr:hypothetical protein [Oscillospiraceae bacterium]
VTERLKQELYQKDFHEEEFTDFFQEELPQKTLFGKYFGFLSAVAVLSVCIGVSLWNLSAQRTNEVFQPSATVPVEIIVTETTETATEVSPDA